MTTPNIPPSPPYPGGPGSSKGMPKWLVIVIIVALVFFLGCCGGLSMCYFACNKAGDILGSAAKSAGQKLEEEMKKQNAAIEAANAKNAKTSTDDSNENGNAIIGPMPSNYPSDVPNFPGLTPVPGSTVVNKSNGSGSVMLQGKAELPKVVAFYEQRLPKEGWTIDNNVEAAGQAQLELSKDNRKLRIVIMPTDNLATVVIAYSMSQ